MDEKEYILKRAGLERDPDGGHRRAGNQEVTPACETTQRQRPESGAGRMHGVEGLPVAPAREGRPACRGADAFMSERRHGGGDG